MPGDVNSTLGATLAAAKLGVPVAHLEAGLRSGDRTMPEEINRIITDRLAELLLVHCDDAVANLRREGVPDVGHRARRQHDDRQPAAAAARRPRHAAPSSGSGCGPAASCW